MLIDVKGLTYRYPGTAKPAIRSLDFGIERGEIFGFLGPSGAGKSTTQKILIGLLREFQGRVSVLGKDLAEWGSELYERIGVSFEFPNHYGKLTGEENLRYFGSLYRGPVRSPTELLEWVGLGESSDQPVSQYSKGMQNRLTLARALAHDPELLFLDEPTAGLDPGYARRIKDLIRQQQEAGKTVFLTTHDMSVAGELCDRLGFIVGGQLSLIDSPRALKIKHGEPVVRVEYRADGQRKTAIFPLQGLAENDEFLRVLRSRVQTIHSQEATLERIFIEVTGRGLT